MHVSNQHRFQIQLRLVAVKRNRATSNRNVLFMFVEKKSFSGATDELTIT